MKILHVVGARPNFMKAAPIMREMAKYPQEFEQLLVHTGQHYDDNMSKVFFEDLELPQPDIYLGVGSGSHAQQTARIMLAFEPVLLEHRPDWVIVASSRAQPNGGGRELHGGLRADGGEAGRQGGPCGGGLALI